MVSVYSCFFNPEMDVYDIRGAVNNWLCYGDEVVFGVLESEAEACERVIEEQLGGMEQIVLAPVNTNKKDPLFLGKLKDQALLASSNPVLIQQDLDERIGGELAMWQVLVDNIGKYRVFFLPVMDLYKDLAHYKAINYKWYLHLKEGCRRGTVNFAFKQNGAVDVEKSDTCELIDEKGNLIPFVKYVHTEGFDPKLPHIVHLGHVDLKKRAYHNKEFWKEYWSALGQEESNVVTEEEKLSLVEVKEHGFVTPWWK